jgi:hypothetical protein
MAKLEQMLMQIQSQLAELAGDDDDEEEDEDWKKLLS